MTASNGDGVDGGLPTAAGQNIYRPDLSSPPYTVSNYPPLYILSIVPFVKLFGPSFLPGWLISVSSTLVSAAFLARIIYIPTRDRLAAVITSLLFLTIPYVVGWSFHVRHFDTPKSWKLFRRTLAVELSILVLALFV